LLAGAGQGVELGPPPGLVGAPPGRDPAALLDAVQRRVERALLDAEQLARVLPDALDDAVAVERPGRERLEDEEVEGALEEVGLAGHLETLGADAQNVKASRSTASSTGGKHRVDRAAAGASRPEHGA